MKRKTRTGLLLMDTCKKIGLFLLIGLQLISCSQRINGNMESGNLNGNKMSNYVEHEKEKAERLMKSFSKPLKEVKATPSAVEMSALYAIGYEVPGEEVFCTIYIYENQQQHENALKLLKNNTAAQKANSITSSNGGLFFWGFCKTDNTKAKYTLNDLVSAFSGEE